MDLRKLSATLAVSPQIQVEDVSRLADAGFRILIANRPDEEVEPELRHETIRSAAESVGMEFHYLPFYPGQITQELITEFTGITSGQAAAVAYCRSGQRCTTLWALSQARKLSLEEINRVADKAGYDLTPVQPLIISLSNPRS